MSHSAEHRIAKPPAVPKRVRDEIPELELTEITQEDFEQDKRQALLLFENEAYIGNKDALKQLLCTLEDKDMDPKVFNDMEVRAAALIACMNLVNFHEAYHGPLKPDVELTDVRKLQTLFTLPETFPSLTLIRQRVSAEVLDFLQDTSKSPLERLRSSIIVEKWLNDHPGKTMVWNTPVEGLPEIPAPSMERTGLDPDHPSVAQSSQTRFVANRPSKRLLRQIKREILEEPPKVPKGPSIDDHDVPSDDLEVFDRRVLGLHPDEDSSQVRERFDRKKIVALADEAARVARAMQLAQGAKLKETIARVNARRTTPAEAPVQSPDPDQVRRTEHLRAVISRLSKKWGKPPQETEK